MILVLAIAAALPSALNAPEAVAQVPTIASSTTAPPPMQAILAAGTPVVVTLNQDLTTTANNVGDIFEVIVAQDVADGPTIVIPQGTVGHGEVTFVTRRGGFGKGGIIGIALRDLDLGGKKIMLDGHYRQEGKSRTGATAATFFAVGVFSGFIKGNESGIPKGRELRARTGEDMSFTPGTSPSRPAAKPPGEAASTAGTSPIATTPTPSVTASAHK